MLQQQNYEEALEIADKSIEYIVLESDPNNQKVLQFKSLLPRGIAKSKQNSEKLEEQQEIEEEEKAENDENNDESEDSSEEEYNYEDHLDSEDSDEDLEYDDLIEEEAETIASLNQPNP